MSRADWRPRWRRIMLSSMSDRGTTLALALAVVALAMLVLIFIAERLWPLGP